MKKSLHSQSKFKYIAIALIFVAIFMVLIRSQIRSPKIAQIDGGPVLVNQCVSNISSFVASGACGNGKVERVDYVCYSPDKKGYEGDPKNCVDLQVAYQHASQFCGVSCITPPATPTPTPTSSPALPSPSAPIVNQITCNLKTYKRPFNMDGWNENQLINPSGASINPGEQLAYAVELINPNKSSIVGSLKLNTINQNGENEPVKVRSLGGLCQLSTGGRTMSCYEEKFQIDGSSVKGLPSMTIVLEVLSPSITGVSKTGVTFAGTLANVPFKCQPATSIAINSSTAIPILTPTPTSTPKICSNEVGSCATTTGTCLAYTDSCAKADFCGTPFKTCQSSVRIQRTLKCLTVFNRRYCLPSYR